MGRPGEARDDRGDDERETVDRPRVERTGVSRRRLLRTVGGAGIAAPFLASTASAEEATVTRLDADVRQVDKRTRIRSYPIYDADGGPTGERTWRTVRGTGNCCENYLAASPDGQLFDMGGDYLFTTPDDGESWTRVGPSTPYPVTSEGCVSAAPGGDVCAIDWNPYSPDRLIAYKYVAEEDRWYYNEVPLHTPFYDRPWFAVFEGPFSVAGIEVPYVTVMKGGGFPEEDAVLYVSLDGLTYELASSRFLDSAVDDDVEKYLDEIVRDSDLDWTQPHTEGDLTPLGDGRALGRETAFAARAGFVEAGCERTLLRDDSDGNVGWHCFDTPAGVPEGRLLADSRGYLHQVDFETATTFVYRYSTDGGRNWREYRQDLPGNYELRDDFLFDFKAHGGLETTAVSVHATDPEAEVDQDMLYKFEGVAPGTEPSIELLYVGKAEVSYVVGVSTEERFDFCTLAILPDGRVAVSFADSEHPDPRVAIELPGATPDGPPLTVEGTRTDDGSTFTGGQTDEIEVSVTPSRDATVRDVVPSKWTVLTEFSDDVARVEKDPEAGVKYVYFAGAAPAGASTDYTYLVEAPEGASKTTSYTFGPVETRAAGGAGWWIQVAGTEDTNVVVGTST